MNPAQDQRVVVVESVGANDVAGGMVCRNMENGCDNPLPGPMPNKGGIAARAQCQRKRIEENGLACPGLAGKHREPRGKVYIKSFDQNDIADRQVRQHLFQPALPALSFRQAERLPG